MIFRRWRKEPNPGGLLSGDSTFSRHLEEELKLDTPSGHAALNSHVYHVLAMQRFVQVIR